MKLNEQLKARMNIYTKCKSVTNENIFLGMGKMLFVLHKPFL